MKEVILENKKNGMRTLLLTTLLMIGAIALTVLGAVEIDANESPLGIAAFVVGLVLLCFGWIPYLGIIIP